MENDSAKSSTDWENLYVSGETPWDKDEPSPGLVDFLAEEPLPEKNTVLVPGCGMGHDAREFARRGWKATGLDISPTAMQRAAKLAGGVEFRAGDFLSDEPFAQFDIVFEHTLFCAIQPDRRDDYVAAVRRWLRPGGRYLAVYYMIDDVDGPPFGSTREEIEGRFNATFRMIREWVPRSYPHRQGLEWMVLWQG